LVRTESPARRVGVVRLEMIKQKRQNTTNTEKLEIRGTPKGCNAKKRRRKKVGVSPPEKGRGNNEERGGKRGQKGAQGRGKGKYKKGGYRLTHKKDKIQNTKTGQINITRKL